MVGIGIASASPGTDAVSMSKSSRSSKSSGDDSSGFLDALSNSGGGRDATASKDTDDTDTADAKPTAPDDGSQTGADALAQSTLPGAAVSPKDAKVAGALNAKGAMQAFAQSLINIPQPAATTAVVPTTPTAAPTKDATAAKVPADLAQQLATMVAGDPAAQPAADAKTGLPTAVKGAKTDTTAGDGKDDDTTDDATANTGDATVATANGAVSDALSLLNIAVPAQAAQTAPGVLAAAGQVHTTNGKVAASGDASVDAQPAGTTAEQPDAITSGMAMLTSRTAGAKDDAAPATGNDDSTTQTVRLVRANTKGQGLDAATSKDSDDATKLDVKVAAGNGLDTVTVLDSRRFVGLASGSNSALVANSLTGNKDWAAAMQPNAALTGASATASASKVVNTLKIQMNPDSLGIVTATMRLSGDQLSVDLKVQSAEAYRQLSNDQTSMADSLRQQGYAVDRITVSYTPSDTSSNSQSGQPGQSSHQGQQQQPQPGASQGQQQGGEAQARRQNSGRQADDQDGVWGAAKVGTDDSVAGSAQRTAAGGVYL